MPTLKPSVGSASALLKSATSIANTVQAIQDKAAADQWLSSGYTDDAYTTYANYLQGRIDSLNSTGVASDVLKAMDLGDTLRTATHSNTSADIAFVSTQVMLGNASDTDKLTEIGNQFTRAEGNGDATLANQLESQYYSLSQKIQYDQQAAATAADTLATANASSEGNVVDQLKSDLKNFTADAAKGGEGQLNTDLAAYAQSKAATFQALGVKINTKQPNLWDVASGVVGAIYNHRVLQAIAEYPVNAGTAAGYVQDAVAIANGTAKFQVGGNSLNLQEIQQASQDPSMFAYNSETGNYNKTAVIGSNYQTFTGYKTVNNQTVAYQYKALVPSYSGIVGNDNRNKVFFLTPTQTASMTQLGLNFSDKSGGTKNVGDGVEIQTTANTPDWFKKLLSGPENTTDQNASTRMYTDSNGSLHFDGQSVAGSQTGPASFTLMKDTNGKFGAFEHLADGQTVQAGSDFGFNWGAASLLVTAGLQLQTQIATSAAAIAATIKLPPPIKMPSVSVSPSIPTPNINIGGTPSNAITPKVVNPQPTSNPQSQSTPSLQSGSNAQAGNFNPQAGGTGIKL